VGKEEDNRLFEKVLKANEKYYTRFKTLLENNRKYDGGKSRDHYVLCDYLEARDAELKGTRGEGDRLYDYLKTHRFNYLFHDNIFIFLERKVLERTGEVI